MQLVEKDKMTFGRVLALRKARYEEANELAKVVFSTSNRERNFLADIFKIVYPIKELVT